MAGAHEAEPAHQMNSFNITVYARRSLIGAAAGKFLDRGEQDAVIAKLLTWRKNVHV